MTLNSFLALRHLGRPSGVSLERWYGCNLWLATREKEEQIISKKDAVTFADFEIARLQERNK